MAAESKKEIELEIAHVLFVDIVGYSKLSVNEQHAAAEELNQMVRASERMTPAIQAELLAGGAAAAERAAALEPDATATEHVLGNVARPQFKYAVPEGHYLRAMQIDPSYFANLYTSKPAGQGWPGGCRPLGETDLECGTP